MSGVGGMPDLSALLAWPTEHLTEAADHWTTVGARSIRDTFPQDPRGDRPARDGRVRGVDNHTFKQDPQPPMSREQAAAGLKDVNRRIWEHNHIDKPGIEQLPPNDPRRADFHVETGLLNAEKQQYLDATAVRG